MRSGITPVVAIALLLGMTVAASGGAYTFISSAQQQAQEDASSALATQVEMRAVTCGRGVVDLALKNTGDTTISTAEADLYIYQGDELHTSRSDVDLSSYTLGPTDLIRPRLFVPDVLEKGTRYTVEIRFPQDDVTVEGTCDGFEDVGASGIWTFDGFDNGTAVDDANGNDGTFTGETFHHADLGGSQSVGPADPEWGDGRFGNGIHFTENQDRVRAHTVLPGGTIPAFTYTAWVYRGTVTGDWQNVIDSGSTRMEFGGGAHDYIGGCIDKNGTVPQQCAWSSGGSLPAGEWHHVAMTYDVNAGSNNLKIYLNGVVADERTYAYETNVNNYIRMSAEDWTGRLDEVRVYTRALNASEVNASMNAHWPVGEPDGAWSFEEGTGQTAHDTHEKVQGRTGGAVTFDGSDDYVDVGAPAVLDIQDNITVAAWVNKHDAGDQYMGIVDKGMFTAGNGQEAWGFASQPNGAVIWRAPWVHYTGDTIPADRWTHMLVTVSNTTQQGTFYLDTEPVHTFTGMVKSRPNRAVTIGALTRKNPGNSFFNGTIDEIQIYPFAVR